MEVSGVGKGIAGLKDFMPDRHDTLFSIGNERLIGVSVPTSQLLASICHLREPRILVDLGTGIGISASILAMRSPEGAEVYTVDDGENYLEDARDRLSNLLDGDSFRKITWIHAPIEGHWYDPERLKRIPGSIGLMMVDGPMGGWDRGKALEMFYDRLAPDAVICLDDCFRPKEKGILLEWVGFLLSKNRKCRVELRKTDRGLGIIELL